MRRFETYLHLAHKSRPGVAYAIRGILMDFERFRPRLRAVVSDLLGPKMKGEIDESGVVQETLLEAFQAKNPCAAPPLEAQVFAWLRQILRRNLIDAIRKAKRTPRKEKDVLETTLRIIEKIPHGGPSPSTEAEQSEGKKRLADAVAALSVDQRFVVEDRILGFSLGETAKRMGKTYGAVASLYSRATVTIREGMNGDL